MCYPPVVVFKHNGITEDQRNGDKGVARWLQHLWAGSAFGVMPGGALKTAWSSQSQIATTFAMLRAAAGGYPASAPQKGLTLINN